MSKKVEIVLVEDYESDAELVIRALNKNNILNALIHLSDGEEALNYIFAEGKYAGRDVTDMPRIILMDIKMPKVSGFDALEKIKADERTRIIPVIMLTSSHETPDVEKSYELGANSYIVKPVNFDEFVKAIAEVGKYWLLLNRVA
jgi:two-component system response regulator